MNGLPLGADSGWAALIPHAIEISSALGRIGAEDAVGQLWRREGRMAALGSDGGTLWLDWVDGVERLLADDGALEGLEAEARAIRQGGIRHIIWAGMGGSVLTVQVLRALGYCAGDGVDGVAIYPLDSTDPAALNAIVRRIASAKHLPPVDHGLANEAESLRALLDDVLMVGVAMGMTSEEPITHLEWFAALLADAGLQPREHLRVMALPDSYLDRFAATRGLITRPLQLDGRSGTGGRMSAPTTRVFLLPAALYLTGHGDDSGRLRAAMRQAWEQYAPSLAADHPAQHPFVQLAAAMSASSREGTCRLLLRMPSGWETFMGWVEQLMEESLGKDGRGVVVFDDQPLVAGAPCYRHGGSLRVRMEASRAPWADEEAVVLSHPALARTDPVARLAALASGFLGWQLAMAIYGYLHGITFAGQPAVENYKSRARSLRSQSDPLRAAMNATNPISDGLLTLLPPPGVAPGQSAAATFAATLGEAKAACRDADRDLDYLDLTFNGEWPADVVASSSAQMRRIGNDVLGIPVKTRRAPAAYHSTEQGEMDGTPCLVSLRLLAKRTEPSLLGTYTDTFLRAQAAGTWQAMAEQGRPCYLLCVDGESHLAYAALAQFFDDVGTALAGTGGRDIGRDIQ